MQSYQQIRVRIEQQYPDGLAGAFPRLHRLLSAMDNRLIDHSPPLIDLVEVLVRMEQDDAQEQAMRRLAARYLGELKELRAQATEAIGDWRLSEAQTALGRMDEVFARLEEELPG